MVRRLTFQSTNWFSVIIPSWGAPRKIRSYSPNGRAVETPRPTYQVNLPPQRSRPPWTGPKLELLDAAAVKLGRAGRFLAGCFRLFFSLVILAFLSALGLFGFAAFTILSKF